MNCDNCGEDLEPGEAWVFPKGKGVYCAECHSAMKCETCDGEGDVSNWKTYSDTCPACKGSGRKGEDK